VESVKATIGCKFFREAEKICSLKKPYVETYLKPCVSPHSSNFCGLNRTRICIFFIYRFFSHLGDQRKSTFVFVGTWCFIKKIHRTWYQIVADDETSPWSPHLHSGDHYLLKYCPRTAGDSKFSHLGRPEFSQRSCS
jgi:hypothetical protein